MQYYSYIYICNIFTIYGAFRDLLPFVQFKKREKHPCRSVKVTLLHGCFSRFLNCAHGTKSHNTPHLNDLNLPLSLRIPISLVDQARLLSPKRIVEIRF